MFGLSFQEFVIVGIIAILLFGKRLPDVAKNLGAKYREFRKGLSEIQSSLNVNVSDYSSSYQSSSSYGSSSATKQSSGGEHSEYDDYDAPTAPKFEPPPSEPQVAAGPASSDVASSDSPAGP